MHRGYVKVWRKFTDSQTWSRGVDYVGLLTVLLMKSNHKPGWFLGVKIERGQIAYGSHSLAKELKVGRGKLRHMLDILRDDGFLTITSTSQFSVITICNYNRYQDKFVGVQPALQPASNQRATSEQPLSKNVKNEKKVTDPNIKTFIDWWFNAYKEKIGEKYLFTGKDAKIIQTLLKTLSLEEVQLRGKQFFGSKDDFIVKAGYTIGVFQSQINKLSTPKPKSFVTEWRRG